MNGKPTHTTRRVWLLVCILAFLSSSVPTSAGVGKSLERGLGSQIAHQVEAETGLVSDPVMSNWVVRLGNNLAEAAGKKDVIYSFKILDSEEVNAMAVPGGYIYVTKGLLRFAQSEDEIASVLGHEVGHIAAGHSMEQMKTQILGSLVLSVFKNKKYASAVGGARLAGMFAMLKFSRDNEREADVLGIRSASAAGYDPKRMSDFFTRMNEKDKNKVSRLESYLLTHPPFSERIANISKQPEMQETAENITRTAKGLASRDLYEQARESDKTALKLSPNFKEALENLKTLPKQEKPVAVKAQADAAPVKVPEERLKSAQDRLKALEKRQANMEKQLKSSVSNLSFTSNIISQYDYMSIREFQLAVDAINDISRVISNISNANASIKESLDETASLPGRINRFGAEAGKVRVEFGKTSEGVLSDIETQGPAVESCMKKTEQASRSLDFAVRQFTSTLMMPRPAELGATGLVETQLQMVKKSLSSELEGSRKLVLNLEATRNRLIITRLDLQTCAMGPETRRMYARRAADYLGIKTEDIPLQSEGFGNGVVTAYKNAVKASIPHSDKEGHLEIDYDSANILLSLLSWDIDREQKAAERTRGNK